MILDVVPFCYFFSFTGLKEIERAKSLRSAGFAMQNRKKHQIHKFLIKEIKQWKSYIEIQIPLTTVYLKCFDNDFIFDDVKSDLSAHELRNIYLFIYYLLQLYLKLVYKSSLSLKKTTYKIYEMLV